MNWRIDSMEDDVEIKGHLRFIVVRLLSKEDGKTGSQLADEIEDEIGSKPSYGSIYPVLKKLKEKDLVNVSKGGRKKIYSLSEKGKNFVKKMDEKKYKLMEAFRDILRTFDTILEDEEVELIIRSLEGKIEKEGGPVIPELAQIQYLLLTSDNVEKEKKKVRKELGRSLQNLKEILEN